MFLRGTGGNAAALGVQQGDAIRNIWGHLSFNADTAFANYGALLLHSMWTSGFSRPGAGNMTTGITFDASRMVPTANENRPVNMAVRYLIRAVM